MRKNKSLFKNFKQFINAKSEYLNFSILQFLSIFAKFMIEFAPSLFVPLFVYGKYSYIFSIGTVVYRLMEFIPLSLLYIPEMKIKYRISTITYQVFIIQVTFI